MTGIPHEFHIYRDICIYIFLRATQRQMSIV